MRQRLLLFFLLLSMPLAGCEEDVVAVTGSDRPYTLYGLLTPQLDTQWVYVFPVEGTLERTLPLPLEARFTSLDLMSGEKQGWNDSLIREPNGEYVHAYWSPFVARYGHAYRLDVQHPDGRLTHVDVAVPPESEIVPEQPNVTIGSAVILPVAIQGGAPRLLKPSVSYVMTFRDTEGSDFTELITIPYDEKQKRRGEEWVLEIDLTRDFRALNDSLVLRTRQPIDRSVGILLHNVMLSLMVVNEEWHPPGGKFDAEVLVQPGVLENVENGYGFVGAGYRLSRRWVPPAEAVSAAGFRAPGD